MMLISLSLNLPIHDKTKMKFSQIPFPRLPLKRYLWISFAIAFSVSFILMVFQPFGTSQFKHPNKQIILMGYGLAVFITMSIFYTLSTQVIHKNKEGRWTILYESIDLFFALTLSILATYVYYIEIFNGSYHLRRMSFFLLNAATVALLPTLGSVVYLYMTWKDVQRSTIEQATEEAPKDMLVLLSGSSKSDKLEATNEEIIMAQAQSNYVMLFLLKDGKIQRHILRSTLKQIKDQLEENQFLQVHRSFIVNRSKIMNLVGNKSKPQLQLSDFDKKIPVSRNMYDQLKNTTK